MENGHKPGRTTLLPGYQCTQPPAAHAECALVWSLVSPPPSSSYHLTTPQNNHYHVSPCPRLSRDSKTRHKHQHFSSSIQPEKDEQVPSKLTGYRPKSFSFSTTAIKRPGCFRMSVLAEASPTIPPPTMTISNELKRKQVLWIYVSRPHQTSLA